MGMLAMMFAIISGVILGVIFGLFYMNKEKNAKHKLSSFFGMFFISGAIATVLIFIILVIYLGSVIA